MLDYISKIQIYFSTTKNIVVPLLQISPRIKDILHFSQLGK